MVVSGQYRVDHRCHTCITWSVNTYDYGHCHRNPHVVRKHRNDWCSFHQPDDQHREEPTLSDLNEQAQLWYEYAWEPDDE